MNNRQLLEHAATSLLDPQARTLAASVDWLELAAPVQDHYPVVRLGSGPPVLMLHGFDSCHLEFRRLVPLLQNDHSLVIPDLYGFGFCPRHGEQPVNPEVVLQHLAALLSALPSDQPVGVIGASMGGSVAMELARRHPDRINKLLLLSPAGLDGKPMPVPHCSISWVCGSWGDQAFARAYAVKPLLTRMLAWASLNLRSLHCISKCQVGRAP